MEDCRFLRRSWIFLLVKVAVRGGALSWRRITHDDSRRFWMAGLSLVSVSQYTSPVIVDPCSADTTKMTPFSSQKTVANIFWLEHRDWFNFFCLGELEWRHCIECCLSSLRNQGKQIIFILSITIQKGSSTAASPLFVLVVHLAQLW